MSSKVNAEVESTRREAGIRRWVLPVVALLALPIAAAWFWPPGQTPDVPRASIPLESTEGAAAAVAFSPDGSAVATAGLDGMIRLRDLKTAAVTRRLTFTDEPNREIFPLQFAKDGRTLIAGGLKQAVWYYAQRPLSPKVRAWDPTTGELKAEFVALPKSTVLRLLDDGKTFAMIGEPVQGKPQFATKPLGTASRSIDLGPEFNETCTLGEIQFAAISDDGSVLAFAGSTAPKIALMDAATGKLLHQLPGWAPTGGMPTSPYGLVFSPDGKSLAVLRAGRVEIFDVAAGTLKATLATTPELDVANAVAFMPDRRRIVVYGAAVQWNWLSRNVLPPFLRSTPAIDGVALIFDVDTAAKLRTLRGADMRPSGFALSPDGGSIAITSEPSGYAPGRLTIWDVER